MPCLEFRHVIKALIDHRNNFVVSGAKIVLSLAEKTIVDELKKREAYDEESAIVDNPSFIKEIAIKLKIKEITVYYYIRSLKNKSIICQKQIGKAIKGQANSKMWLSNQTDYQV